MDGWMEENLATMVKLRTELSFTPDGRRKNQLSSVEYTG